MTERAPILPLTPNPLLKRMRRRPIPARARKWLNAEGSLTRRLNAVCDTVHIQILHQRQAALWPLEKKALGRQRHQQGGATHVRTVLQWCGEPDTAFPGVFARSAVLAPQARLSWGSLRGLGNRPLAHLLFVAPGIRRTPLFYQYDPPHAPETRHVLRQWQQQAGAHADRLPQRGIWRRYSVFLHRGAPLIVTEWFAPEVLDWPIDHRKLTPIRRLQPRIQKQQHRRA